VCLHGWQDNAGTFDRLIPLLPREYSYLAIDLLGHGLSSWIPDGMQYHREDNLHILNLLMEEYNWDKISLIGHSMGSLLCWVFAAVFPSKVDCVIAIDALKPQIHDPVMVSEILADRYENFKIADKRNQEKSEPPSYTLDEMVEKLVDGTYDSVNRDCAPYLLKRNIKRSEKHPGKFYFARDSRLKYLMAAGFSQDMNIALAKRINIPYMFLKGKQSPYYERKIYHDEVVDIMKQNPNFEYHLIDAKHHLHLTDPEKIADICSAFINKHRMLKSKL
jgi:pimeloyl-ACP methyl ester carboxylesterase